MRTLLRPGAITLCGALLITLFAAAGSGAAAQQRPAPPATDIIEHSAATDDPAPAAPDQADAIDPAVAPTLAALVEQQPEAQLSDELTCLAGAIYFEAKSESLAGQLAVGRVVVARTHSRRFPASYCGVVYQHAQFSFVRGGAMPDVSHATAMWRHAVAIARIADAGSWQSPVEGALFFHAARVTPAWRLTRIAQVDNHVFYR